MKNLAQNPTPKPFAAPMSRPKTGTILDFCQKVSKVKPTGSEEEEAAILAIDTMQAANQDIDLQEME